MKSLKFGVDDELRYLGVFIYYGMAYGVVVERGRVDIREHARKLVNDLIRSYSIERVRELPIIRCYRNIMLRLGIDPIKVRVSSEALLRRVLRSASFPHINNVVDSCNLASLETLIPISVFDLGKIAEGIIKLRKARPKELFVDIDGGIELLKGNEIVLAIDDFILHVYPHRDSINASIDANTKDVLTVAYGVQDVPKTLVRDAVSKVLKYLMMYCGARNTQGPYYVD